eukprot:15308573-Alexandrium_andersonii.AAC.1
MGSALTRMSLEAQALAVVLGEVEDARGEVPRGLLGGSTSMGRSEAGAALALASPARGPSAMARRPPEPPSAGGAA